MGKGAQNPAMMAFKPAPAYDGLVSAPSNAEVAANDGADPAGAADATPASKKLAPYR